MKNRLAAAKLRHELRSAGAQESELGALSALAGDLRSLKVAASTRRPFIPIGVTAVVGLFVGAVLVTFSQTSLPGTVLYPVKKVSERVAVTADPDYRGIVMMRRAQEVKQLVARHAPTGTVLATLADYQREALAYTSNSSNYSVFEFCKTNLRQAAAGASGPQQRAIQQTLASLDSV